MLLLHVRMSASPSYVYPVYVTPVLIEWINSSHIMFPLLKGDWSISSFIMADTLVPAPFDVL